MENEMEQTLYGLIEENPSLVYLDTQGNAYSVRDLTIDLPFADERKLAFLYVDNSISSISILLSCLKGKWVLALLNAKMDPVFKAQLEQQYRPAFIYDPILQSRKDYKTISFKSGISIMQGNDRAVCLHPQLRVLLNTSGSTGSPKFVKLSESNLVENARSILAYLPIENSDVTPLNLPIHYSYGLSVLTTNSIKGGRIVCGCSDLMQAAFWEEWTRFGYTSLAGVPYVYETLKRLKFLERKHPGLRYLTQAGGKLNAHILKDFAHYAQENRIDYYVMYGQTEATARMSYLPPDRLFDKLGSIGRPIQNGLFQIDASTDELLYAGPNVFGGYAINLRDLACFDQADVLHTGDLATKDNEGFFFITGRLKRIVKLAGTRINLDEIEEILKNNFAGMDFVCLGIEDAYLYVCSSQAVEKQQAIKEILHQRIRIHPKQVKICTLDAIARTANGKVDYKAMASALAI